MGAAVCFAVPLFLHSCHSTCNRFVFFSQDIFIFLENNLIGVVRGQQVHINLALFPRQAQSADIESYLKPSLYPQSSKKPQ